MRLVALAVWVALALGTGAPAANAQSAQSARAAESAESAESAKDAHVEIMRVLDQYMDALNALDLVAHIATYRFPHFRFAGGELAVWHTREEAMPLLTSPPEERREGLRQILGAEWDRSVWTRRDVVQADASKVHVATRFARLRADGSEIRAFESLYILTSERGRWAIQGRSSFAP